jgi:hypothetical protein
MAKRTKKQNLLFVSILAIATLLGGVVAVLALLPRPVITPSDPVDIANPFSASFTVSNANFIPLYNVNVSLGIGQIVTYPRQIDPNFIPSFESRLTCQEWCNHTLNMDERFTISIAKLLNLKSPARLNGGDIAIVVSYKPWISPFYRDKIFRFIAQKQTNGFFYWYSYPLE